MSNKEHWEKIYNTKTPSEVSWTQEKPTTSLDLIDQCELEKDARIIDIGGGDSHLVDFLLAQGYNDLTVLDISSAAIQRAKTRLGSKANKVTWIISDITKFQPTKIYDVWHDRAVFHFLTSDSDIAKYKQLVSTHSQNIVLGTFSKNGPLKCSGLEITQYDEQKIRETFSPPFDIQNCFQTEHLTPFDTIQNFTFALLGKL